MKEASYSKTLRQCADIADERQEQYGDVKGNFIEIQQILSAAFGIELSLTEIAKVMIATKLSREKHKPKQDNRQDCVNYMAILDYLYEL